MRLSIMGIQTSLHPLNRADGSATYTSPNGYSILAAVNGPVEVQRRDELPDEAHIEVNVRPHDGVGQVKERHLELLIANTLRDVVFVQMFPRQMVQLTLQIMKIPADDSAVGRGNPQAETVHASIVHFTIIAWTNVFFLVPPASPLAPQCSLSRPR
jgi:3' exoribonuclease family, domain 1